MHFFASYIKVSKSSSAIFSYCPACGVERTIQFRIERKYFAILKIPVYPVGDARDVARCVACRNEFTPETIERTHHAFQRQTLENLAVLLSAFMAIHGIDNDRLMERVWQIFQSQWEPPPNLLPSQVDAIFVAAVNRIRNEGADLGLISRFSDPIQLEDKNRLVEAAASVLQMQAIPPAKQCEALFEFANALGLSVDQVAWIVKRATKSN